MTLQNRLLAGSALLVVGLSASFVVLFTLREVRSVEAGLDARGRDLAGHLARVGRLGVLARDRSALRGPAEAALDAPGVLLVRYLVDRTPLYESRRGEQAGRVYRARVIVAGPAGDDGLELFDDDAADRPRSQQAIGMVEVGLDPSEADGLVREALITGGGLMMLFLVAGIVAAWLLSVRVLEPLSALTEGVRSAAQGDLGRRVHVAGPEEVAELGRAYNDMADALQSRTTELERQTRELERQTRELERQTRDLEEFVYIASHDLQSPLISIQGFAERLQSGRGPELDDRQRRWLERIQANVENMGTLIRGILDLSRLNTQRNEPAQGSARGLVEGAVAGAQDAAERRGVRISVVGEAWPEVAGDLIRLQSVFANLVDNAIKYMGDEQASPEVEVGCKIDGERGIFWVRDNGVGIAPEYQSRVFRPLERLKSVEAHGIGMGLTLVRKIVEIHGGELTLESELGQGSTFRFTLPVAPPPSEAGPGGEVQADGGSATQ